MTVSRPLSNKKKDKKKTENSGLVMRFRSVELLFYGTVSAGIILFVVQPIKYKSLLMVVIPF